MAENSRFVSSAAFPLGNLTNLGNKLARWAVVSLIHLPAVLLEMFKESPISKWIAPVAKKRRHNRTCSKGVNGWLRCVFLWRFGSSPRINMTVSGRKRYLSNTSSASRSSSGFERSLKYLGRLCCCCCWARSRIIRLWAAMFCWQTTLEYGSEQATKHTWKFLSTYSTGARVWV